MVKIKEPVNALTHMAFSALSVPVTILLVVGASPKTINVIAFAIFGIALFLLYTASGIYHALNVSEKVSTVLRKIDHIMIFVLIAGTYTPICLLPLRGLWGNIMLFLVWGMTILGIAFKILWIDAPRWVTTSIYVVMGWIVVIAFYPLTNAVSLEGVALLIAGGIFYTVGAVIYAIKKPAFLSKFFGFHEIFHIFVMLGSLFHVLFMFLYVAKF